MTSDEMLNSQVAQISVSACKNAQDGCLHRINQPCQAARLRAPENDDDTTGQALLCAHHLTKTFPGHREPVVADVTFCVWPGEVLALVGPSGCGKTTTLRTVMGFDPADSGEVLHNGRLLQGKGVHEPPERRGIGFVFQDYALFPHLSVLQNVMFGVRGHPRRRRRQIAKEALWMVGLMGMEDRRPHDLSGGQQQRVALARAIAPGSRVILMDEPFSNLDPELRQATRSEVRTLAHRAGMAVVLVTHDQEEALSTADRLAVMRQGRLVQSGTPEGVYNHPRSDFVAQFLGRTNLLHARARGDVASTTIGEIRIDRTAHGPVTLSLRPEHLQMHPSASTSPNNHPARAALRDHNTAAAEIVAREFKGHDITFRLRIGPDEYLVQTDYDAPFRVGDRVHLSQRALAAVVGIDTPHTCPNVCESDNPFMHRSKINAFRLVTGSNTSIGRRS